MAEHVLTMHPLHNVPTCWLPVPLVLLAQQQLQQRVAWSWNWQYNLDSSNMEEASLSWESQSFPPNCLFWNLSSTKYGWWIIVDQWDQSFKIIGSTKLQNTSITIYKLQTTFYTVTNPRPYCLGDVFFQRLTLGVFSPAKRKQIHHLDFIVFF